MHIQDLHQIHAGETIYIVGTGPSLRCFDLSFFNEHITIGLNQAWRHLEPTYSITVHPELLADYDAVKPRRHNWWSERPTRWVVKRKPPRADLQFTDPQYYVFDTSYVLKSVRLRPQDTLYLGEGVQTCAMDLAARMGARHIVLVGCDGYALNGDCHAHDQHVKWLGMKPDDQYALYRQSTAEVRGVLRTLGVSVMSMTPFIGIAHAHEDYARLTEELKLPKLPAPKDLSAYTRDPSSFRVNRGE